MGQDLYRDFSSARQTFDEADAALGFSLSHLCFEGPETELRRTDNVQPALLTTSIACLRAVQQAGSRSLPFPSFVAGHSLGEYTALVAAGVLNLGEALKLVRERGRLMYQTGEKNQGSMLAIIGLDRTTTEELCQETGTEVSNVNCPGQLVISGAVDALEAASSLAKSRGARRLISLKVSGAFHSSLMEPIIAEFSAAVLSATLRPPAIPIVGNVTARPLLDVASIRQELVQQLRRCIQWQSSVEYMTRTGVNAFYEIGPGTVLTGLVKRIEPTARTFNIGTSEDIAQLVDLANSS
jgi:[acyl-carrier-protein] S-malonyltransferase